MPRIMSSVISTRDRGGVSEGGRSSGPLGRVPAGVKVSRGAEGTTGARRAEEAEGAGAAAEVRTG